MLASRPARRGRVGYRSTLQFNCKLCGSPDHVMSTCPGRAASIQEASKMQIAESYRLVCHLSAFVSAQQYCFVQLFRLAGQKARLKAQKKHTNPKTCTAECPKERHFVFHINNVSCASMWYLSKPKRRSDAPLARSWKELTQMTPTGGIPICKKQIGQRPPTELRVV